MTQQPDFQMTVGGCCDDPGLCIFDCCCPCFTLMEAATNIGDDCPVAYCLAACCGLACCALGVLGKDVANRRNIEMDMGKSCFCSCFNCCTCYSCRVVNESRLYKANPNATGGQAVVKTTVTTTTSAAPKAQDMGDR
mmetsp:Transcript_24087/g.39856  ORF Transcript_24087/g.39856 Transcript_24087/m.39856 type:complete len:137 (-) Transcript_24087:675-1085(-)|eukprot:CAMPEP_0119010950 /NCGR_PEP_ID=MMETSP1176-20130426/5354_1 /TAXON_ID=265551 /ORGANISM="Synedropsis recta cf, Strain CCMP1620" /LENGTH=136 /DNA_ID=CAMNT_0006963699 /DNA_START=49 /DNA_END=459 /DNA_ORIENTATION=-